MIGLLSLIKQVGGKYLILLDEFPIENHSTETSKYINEDRINDIKPFLIENGYPEQECGSPVFCYRLWEEEVIVTSK